jgi:hypothetical protein
MNFLDVYCIPLVGYTINRYLSIRDQNVLGSTCKDAQSFLKEFVHPMCKTLNLDDIAKQVPETHLERYVNQLISHAHTIRPCYDAFVAPPFIHTAPHLRNYTIAIPLVLNTDERRIDDTTTYAWITVRNFLRSLSETPNAVTSVRIVPGCIKLLSADSGFTIEDYTEGSHLRVYRWFQFPVMLYDISLKNTQLTQFHGPSHLMALGLRERMEKCVTRTDWSGQEQGAIFKLLALFAL